MDTMRIKAGTLLSIISSRLAGTALCTIRVSQIPRWVCFYTIRKLSAALESTVALLFLATFTT
jgi:hypothetical protein